MESVKTKSEKYYSALLEDPRIANKFLIEILEDEKKMEKNKVEKNGTKKK